ncbi:conjugative transposon protein TraN [Chryseobacterium sp. 2987]|uniref:conjugative transposon protein TraN n=1 Tax=Chryseobacterium sp. 2987 TaxID=2817767 RepID=UPI0028643BC6|nr:conjugative transposon protein TraN [Chryseobacterium sp. 2987]MDR6919523.1 conjugative transposon TraN protein [Chryseobacterium sp. 2987]
MKSIIKKTIITICVMLGFINSQAQAVTDSLMQKLDSEKIEPYHLTVTYNKTTHLIFPSAIRYVDLGSEYLTAGKADDAKNVLRIKAAVKDFQEESNFSVITDDGKFYSFSVFYSSFPSILTYNLELMAKSGSSSRANIQLEDLGFSPSMSDQLMEAIYKRNRNNIRHIASKSFGIQFSLKGIYIHDGKYYFNTEIQNKSNVSFQIDFINFKIIDKKVAKRTVFQEKPLNIIRTYSDISDVPDNTTSREVYLLDQFTLDHDKILVIEVFEKNGGRHQRLEIENEDLIRAVLLKDLPLKIK